eukprot:4355677-Pleurochrysis_carterae.AAC.2
MQLNTYLWKASSLIVSLRPGKDDTESNALHPGASPQRDCPEAFPFPQQRDLAWLRCENADNVCGLILTVPRACANAPTGITARPVGPDCRSQEVLHANAYD